MESRLGASDPRRAGRILVSKEPDPLHSEVELTRFRGLLQNLRRRGGTMPKSHTPYSPEFRQQMVELVRSGRSPESLVE